MINTINKKLIDMFILLREIIEDHDVLIFNDILII